MNITCYKCSTCILGVTLVIFLMSGCSSRLQTRVVSQDFPSLPEKVELQEPTSDEAMKDATTATAYEMNEGAGSVDIPVQLPPQPTIRKQPSPPIFTTPKASTVAPKSLPTSEDSIRSVEEVAQPQSGLSQPSTGMPTPPAGQIAGIPNIDTDPEVLPMPRSREDSLPATTETVEAQQVYPPHEDTEAVPQVKANATPTPREQVFPEPGPLEVAKLVPEEEPILPQVMESEESRAALADVYFDYDRFGLRDEDFSILTTNADLLASHFSGQQLVLEGHCDERGTESYNMILGKRRARTVKDFLVDLGIPEDHVSVVSFGKDKPFCTEQTTQCWQENRRVHFVVQ